MYLSVAAAAIYMASQASEHKKTQKGKLLFAVNLLSAIKINFVLQVVMGSLMSMWA